MPKSEIPNDDLGEWGESQFRGLCAAAGLVANKAERDKMGWDFIVEMPPGKEAPALPLDQRPIGLRCRVQVKTHWRRDDDRFQTTLSAAERLAKDPGPAFIVVLTAEHVDDKTDPRLVDCHLIHLLEDNLARVLKRLREREAIGSATSLLQQQISYSPLIAGERLHPAGAQLRDALCRACGNDLDQYFRKKADQLRNLGYTTGRYHANTVIKAATIDEFVEMTLGLRPAPLENLDVYDIRFGVPIPVKDFEDASRVEARINPPHVDKCTIRIRNGGLLPPAVFRGEVLLPAVPNIPTGHPRMLIEAPFLH